MARATERDGMANRFKGEAGGLADALAQRAVSAVRDKVENATGRLTDYVENGAGPGLTAAITGAKDLAEGKSPARSLAGAGISGLKEKVSGIFGGKGKGGGRQKLKLTNIVESIDVGVPVRVAYNQWTEFSQFPSFTKKVESVERNKNEDQKLSWKAQIFWSHRTWEATITDQRPDERIVWKSKGQKGHVNGTVTFHELAPNLTRIIVILEYHPQGLFERTGNIWRAQGRRARLELKHFARHVMTATILNPDEVEGWRGVIEDGEVVKDHETAARDEQDHDEQDRHEQDRRDRARDDENDRAPDDEAESSEDDARSANSRGRRAAPRRQSRQQAGKTSRAAQRPRAASRAREEEG